MNQETAETAEIGEAPAEPTSPIPNFTVLLSPTRRGARLARLLATEQLRTWGLPLDAAQHIVGELAANAAIHGRVSGRNFRLTLYVVGDILRIEVTDTRGDRLPLVQHPDTEGESGRGLVLVEALADRWGVSTGRTPRKTVWAEITVPAPGLSEQRLRPGHLTEAAGPTAVEEPARRPAGAGAGRVGQR